MKYLVLFLCLATSTYGQWNSRTRFVGDLDYYMNVMTDTMHELERIGWSTLKVDDVTQTIASNMYTWRVAGTVQYTNGFVVSMEKLDVTTFSSRSISDRIDNRTVAFSHFTGILNLRQLKVGWDVLANITGEGLYRTTGTYLYPSASIVVNIERNLETMEFRTNSRISGLQAGSGLRMQYLPTSNITQVLGRSFIASVIYDSVARWGSDVIAPLMLDVVNREKHNYPSLCYFCDSL